MDSERVLTVLRKCSGDVEQETLKNALGRVSAKFFAFFWKKFLIVFWAKFQIFVHWMAKISDFQLSLERKKCLFVHLDQNFPTPYFRWRISNFAKFEKIWHFQPTSTSARICSPWRWYQNFPGRFEHGASFAWSVYSLRNLRPFTAWCWADYC